MSMTLVLVTLGDAGIARVLDDPPLVWRVIAPANSEIYREACDTASKGEHISGLPGLKETQPADFKLSNSEGFETDLGKSWHGIHYLFNGTIWEGKHPLDFLVNAGRPVGDIDAGYGPVRTFTAAEVRTIREAVEALTDDELRARFDPTDMIEKDIYPGNWDRDPGEDDTLGYLIENVQLLRSFLGRAVETGTGAVVYLA